MDKWTKSLCSRPGYLCEIYFLWASNLWRRWESRTRWTRSYLPGRPVKVLSLGFVHSAPERHKIVRTVPGRILGPTGCKSRERGRLGSKEPLAYGSVIDPWGPLTIPVICLYPGKALFPRRSFQRTNVVIHRHSLSRGCVTSGDRDMTLVLSACLVWATSYSVLILRKRGVNKNRKIHKKTRKRAIRI